MGPVRLIILMGGLGGGIMGLIEIKSLIEIKTKRIREKWRMQRLRKKMRMERKSIRIFTFIIIVSA